MVSLEPRSNKTASTASNADGVLLMSDASVYLIPAILIICSWAIFRFADHDLEKDLREWAEEEIPLHPSGDVTAEPVLGPAHRAVNVELTPEFLLARINRNNDAVATATSGIALALSHVFISGNIASPALSVALVVISFFSAGFILKSRPMRHKSLSPRGFSFSSSIFVLVYLSLAAYTLWVH